MPFTEAALLLLSSGTTKQSFRPGRQSLHACFPAAAPVVSPLCSVHAVQRSESVICECTLLALRRIGHVTEGSFGYHFEILCLLRLPGPVASRHDLVIRMRAVIVCHSNLPFRPVTG